MKQGKNPTRDQKKILTKNGKDYNDYLFIKEHVISADDDPSKAKKSLPKFTPKITMLVFYNKKTRVEEMYRKE